MPLHFLPSWHVLVVYLTSIVGVLAVGPAKKRKTWCSKRFSDVTPNTAIIGSGSISFSQMYEHVSKTADQNGPRAGHVQNIRPKVASPLWHLEHAGSISGNILASLLLEKCSLWIILNYNSPCLTHMDVEWIHLTADCQTVSGTTLPKWPTVSLINPKMVRLLFGSNCTLLISDPAQIRSSQKYPRSNHEEEWLKGYYNFDYFFWLLFWLGFVPGDTYTNSI